MNNSVTLDLQSDNTPLTLDQIEQSVRDLHSFEVWSIGGGENIVNNL
jgi:hypothetical protein